MHEIEIIVDIWLQGIGKWLLIPMEFFSFLGAQYFLIFLTAWFYWCVDIQMGIQLGIAMVIGNSLNTALKWIFHLPRPYWISYNVKALGVENSFGFPSGHAMMSAIFYGRIALWVRKRWFTVIIFLLLSLIGFSRMYLGVHFLSDVIAGWCFGIALLIIMHRFEKLILQWLPKGSIREKVTIFFISSILLILLFSGIKSFLSIWEIPDSWIANVQSIGLASSIDPIRLKDIYALSGLWFGMMTGFTYIYRIRDLEIKGTQIQYLLRFLIGLTGLILIMFIFNQFNNWFINESINLGITYFQYFVISIWIAAVAPTIFVKIGIVNKKDN